MASGSTESQPFLGHGSSSVGKPRKVVVVTGCSEGGIGAALCRAFASQGCRVFATARRLESVQPLRDAGMEVLQLDVTSSDSIAAAVKDVLAKAGRVDVLVNNAGSASMGPLLELPMESVRANFDTNVFGALALTQALVPHMLPVPPPQIAVESGSTAVTSSSGGSSSIPGGVVVNVGSVVGWLSTPWSGVYASTKSALHSLSHTLRLELEPLGVRVVLAIPGAIRSNFGSNSAARLPDRSRFKLYAPYVHHIEARANASQSASSTPAEVFAAGLANAVLRDQPPREFVCGHLTMFFAILRSAPLWLRDAILRHRFMRLPRTDRKQSNKQD